MVALLIREIDERDLNVRHRWLRDVHISPGVLRMLRKFAVQPPPIDLEMYEQLLRVGIDQFEAWMRLDD